MKKPQITVLMSVHNGQAYLSQAIISILGQNFSDFEFIIIDDASTDDTWQILQTFAKKDRRIVLIQNECNLGLTKSLNIGLKHSHGKYIARQDADDVSLPPRLEEQFKLLEKNPEICAVGSWAQIINQKGERQRILKTPVTHEEIIAHLLLYNPMVHTSLFTRKKVLNEIGGYNENIAYAQDYYLWWKLSQKGRLACIGKELVRRRQMVEGSIAALNMDEQLKSINKISLEIAKDIVSLAQDNLESYDHFWWAWHGDITKWKTGDTKNLCSLWKHLSKQAVYRYVWSAWLLRVAGLVKSHNKAEGFELAKVTSWYFRNYYVWIQFIKQSIKRQVHK